MRKNKTKINIILSAMLGLLSLASGLILPNYKYKASADVMPEGFFVAGVVDRKISYTTSAHEYDSSTKLFEYATGTTLYVDEENEKLRQGSSTGSEWTDKKYIIDKTTSTVYIVEDTGFTDQDKATANYGDEGWAYKYDGYKTTPAGDPVSTEVFIHASDAYDNNEVKEVFDINFTYNEDKTVNSRTITYNNQTLVVDTENNKLKFENGAEWTLRDYEIEDKYVVIYTLSEDHRNSSTPYIMLNNFMSEQNVSVKHESNQNVESFYLGVGKKFVGNTDASQGRMEISHVQAYLNNDYVYDKYKNNENYKNNSDLGYGIYIKSNDIQIQTGEQYGLAAGQYNQYWYQYFDLRSVYAITDGAQDNIKATEYVPETEGLYTVVVDYNHIDASNNSTNGSLVYQFYLMADNSYYDAPDLNRNALTYLENNSGYGTYYNEYQTGDLPVYVYDATKYNATYNYTYSSTNDAFTTNFSLRYDGNVETGVMTTSRNGSEYQTVEMTLDKTNNQVIYKQNGAQFATLKLTYNATDECTDFLFSLTNVSDYQNVLVKRGPANQGDAMPVDYYYVIIANELGQYQFNYRYVVNGGIKDGVGEYHILPDAVKDPLKNIILKEDETLLKGNQILAKSTYKNGYITLPGSYIYRLYLGNLKWDNPTTTDKVEDYAGVYEINNNVVTMAERSYDIQGATDEQGENSYYYQHYQVNFNSSGVPTSVIIGGRTYNVQKAFEYDGKVLFETTGNKLVYYDDVTNATSTPFAETYDPETYDDDSVKYIINETKYTPQYAIRIINKGQYMVLYINNNTLYTDSACNNAFKEIAYDYATIKLDNLGDKVLYVKTKLYTTQNGEIGTELNEYYSIEKGQVVVGNGTTPILAAQNGAYFYIYYNSIQYFLVDKLYNNPNCLDTDEATNYPYTVGYNQERESGENFILNRIVTFAKSDFAITCGPLNTAYYKSDDGKLYNESSFTTKVDFEYTAIEESIDLYATIGGTDYPISKQNEVIYNSTTYYYKSDDGKLYADYNYATEVVSFQYTIKTVVVERYTTIDGLKHTINLVNNTLKYNYDYYIDAYDDDNIIKLDKSLYKDIEKNYVADSKYVINNKYNENTLTYSIFADVEGNKYNLNEVIYLTSDPSLDGGCALYNYGTKAYFYNRESEKTDFEQLTEDFVVRSQITKYITDQTIFENDLVAQFNSLSLYANKEADGLKSIPKTNLQPIYFDYFGSYNYSSTYTSRYYYFDRDSYTVDANGQITIKELGKIKVNGDEVDDTLDRHKTTLLPAAGISPDGLYIAITDIWYMDIDSVRQDLSQVYAFIIDNSAPALNLQYKDSAEDADWKNLSTGTKYTNKALIGATWADPNYFEADVYVEVLKYPINAYDKIDKIEPISVTRYTREDFISLGTSGFTEDGYYIVRIYYGNKQASKRNTVFIKDTSSPVGSVYNIITTDEKGNALEKEDYKYIQAENNIFATDFTFNASLTKDSGASIEAKYIKVPFDVNISFEAEQMLDGVSTNVTLNMANTLFNSSNLEPYTLCANNADTITLGKEGNMLYVFNLIDKAGNESYYYYIFDTSKPYYVFIDPKTGNAPNFDNTSNIIDKQTQVYWGNYKNIELTGELTESDNMASFAKFKEYLDANPSKFGGLALKSQTDTDTTKYYLQLPLTSGQVSTNVSVVDNNGATSSNTLTATTPSNGAMDVQFTGYLPKETPVVDYSKWVFTSDGVTLTSTDQFVLNFFRGGSKTYNFTVTDVLKNNNSDALRIITDKAQLQFRFDGDGNYDTFTSKAYNANELRIIYNDTVTGEDGSEKSVTYIPYVTYDFYPFNIENYLEDSKVETKDKDQTLVSYYYDQYSDDGKLGYFTPTYPFKIHPTRKNVVAGNNKLLNDTGMGLSNEGLYVFKRVYKDEFGNIVTQDQISNISENDVAVKYMYVIIDRKDVFTIDYLSNGNVSLVNSIGDYFKVLLGTTAEGKQENTVISADILNTLSVNLGANSLFSTNKVNVNFVVPYDKYATVQKLNSDNTRFEANTADEVYYYNPEAPTKLYQDDKYTTEVLSENYSFTDDGRVIIVGKNADIAIPIINNTVTVRGSSTLVKIASSNNNSNFGFKVAINGVSVTSDDDLFNVISNASGEHTITINDKSDVPATKNSANAKNIEPKTKSFKYRITHTPPKGSYISAINDSIASEVPLTIHFQNDATNVIYNDINKDVLKFTFTDSLDIYNARINPLSVKITKNGTPIITVTDKEEMERLNEAGILRKELVECDCICEQCNADNPNHSACTDSNNFDKHHAYKYTYTIFDKFNDPDGTKYPAISTEDAEYKASIDYIGDQTSYVTDSGASFFSATYTIKIDRTPPQNNLNRIIEADDYNTYDSAEDKAAYLKTYFFPISNNDNNPFVFIGGGENSGDSARIFVRKINNITNYIPSILPNETDVPTGGIPFSEERTEFVRIEYDNGAFNIANGSVWINDNTTFSFQSRTYYEIIESDEAGNYTRYGVYVYNSNANNFSIKYNLNDNEDAESIEKEIKLDQVNNFDIFKLKSIKYVNEEVIENGENNDGYVTVTISSVSGATTQLVETINSSPLTETWADFFERVVARFNDIAENTKDVYTYQLNISNRFGDDYVITLNIPGSELELIYDESVANTVKVNIPSGINNVYLTQIKIERFENGAWTELRVDDAAIGQTIINKIVDGTDEDDNAILLPLTPLATPYMFGEGQYRFTAVDNYLRTTEKLMYVGSKFEDNYTLTYSTDFITEERQINDFQIKDGNIETTDIILTNIDVTSGRAKLNIDRSLWQIELYKYSGGAWSKYTDFNTVANTGSSLSSITVEKTGLYCFDISWITSENNSYKHFFEIKQNTLTVVYWSASGTLDSKDNDVTYNDDFTIEWFSDYATSGYITYTSVDGVISTTNIDNNTKQYLVDKGGYYKVYLKNAIGETFERNFTKNETNYTYYGVFEGAKQLTASPYTTTDLDTSRTIHYYYVKYDTTIPNIHIEPETARNIKIVPVKENALTINEGELERNGDFNEYKVCATINDNEFVICLVRIYFIKQTNNFIDAELAVKNNDGTDKVLTSATDISLNSSATLTFNKYNSKDATVAADFSGNIVYAEYYYNNELQRTISSLSQNATDLTQSIELKRAGLHTFKFYDLAGNIQTFETSNSKQVRELNIFILNDIVYTIDGNAPIENAIFNSGVSLDLLTGIRYNTTEVGANNTTTPTQNQKTLYKENSLAVSITKNDKEYVISPTINDVHNNYTFTESGYYTVGIVGTVEVYDVTTNTIISKEINTQYNFTIVNANIAKHSFNLPSSYGFSIIKVLRNGGDITNTLQSTDSIWLSSGQNNTNNSVYTITCAYFNPVLNATQTFEFSVWINDSSPVIVPVNYTYGTSTKKPITLQYDLQVIYSEIGEGYISIICNEAKVDERIPFDASSPSGISDYKITKTGTYTIAIYNNEDKLVSSYQAIKKTPLNTSYKIIIIVTSVVVVALAAVFIFIRKKQKFR